MPRYMIILNPIAGKGIAINALPQIEALLAANGLDFTITQTERPGHANEIARKAAEDGYDYVVAAGGDGTANEVLNGLLQYQIANGKAPSMGVIPVGRGNDFAYGAHIPANVDEACALLASPQLSRIDIGKISGGNFPQGLYFGNGVGIGFDAVVGFIAAKTKFQGMLSYIIAAIEAIFLKYKSPTVVLSYGDESHTLSTLMVSVMNGRRMGGVFIMTPSSLITDGLFNLCIVKETPQMKMVDLMVKFMKGTHEEDPYVLTAQTNKIKVTAVKGTLPVHADGNTICEEGQEVEIELLPHALEIITNLEI
ncbi:MAG: diacylglycerol kinase family lipid kinase [Anaerolineaceae bacterium]|nr:diacylglycerol kinase family lipid kinase [Anaerolineaceae bacterium]